MQRFQSICKNKGRTTTDHTTKVKGVRFLTKDNSPQKKLSISIKFLPARARVY